MALNLKDSRYSLLEITRFLFALWILNGHGLFYGNINEPGQAYCVAVCFFFIVSGFFCLKQIDGTTHRNPIAFAFRRIWDIDGVPIILLTILNVVSYFLWGRYVALHRLTHFLWYIDALVPLYIVFFLLRKYVKDKRVFIGVSVALCLGAFGAYPFTMRVPGLHEMMLGIGSFSLGVLLTYVPRLSINPSRGGRIAECGMVLGILLLFAILIIYALKGSIYEVWQTYVVVFALFVPLFYLEVNVPFKNGYVNILGMLATPLYIYQELSWFLLEWNIFQKGHLIYWLPMVFALIEVAIRIFFAKPKRKETPRAAEDF